MADRHYRYLYHKSPDTPICTIHLPNSSRYERKANKFAAGLLMPEATVYSMLREHDLGTATGRVRVSTEVLQRRLTN